MRIGIDTKVLAHRLRGGIGIYTLNLVRHLVEMDQSNEYFLYSNSRFESGFVDHHPNLQIRTTSHWRRNLWLHVYLPGLLKKDKIDVFHSPETILPLRRPCKCIVTVHDLIPLLFPHHFLLRHRWLQRLLLPYSIKHADGIVAVSENTKRDLVRELDVKEEKIRVIYPGVDQIFHPIGDKIPVENLKRKHSITSPFILYVGNIEPRKNVDKIIDAYAIVRRKMGAKVQLIIAGSQGWLSKDIFKKMEQSEYGDGIRYVGHVPSQELPLLYSAATVFVYPSAYEGFGFPALEAMACGTPVVTSDRGSLPEVTGGAGILVNPFSEQEIADAVIRLLENTDLRNLLREKGIQRARSFSWKKSAQDVLDSYQKLAPG